MQNDSDTRNVDLDKIHKLDNRWWVVAVYLASLGILLLGALHAPYNYDDPRLVAGFWVTETIVVLMLWLATWRLFPASRIGLRRPVLVNAFQLIPLGLLVAASIVVWLYIRLTLHPAIMLDNLLSLRILRTTLLVGISEEWMYRGILLAALSRWFGLRRGIFISLFLFGVLHLFNIISGMSLQFAILQFFMTMLIGASLALAAIGSRTVLIPMLAHGIYDFCVIDTITSVQAGAPGWPILIVTVTGIVCGLISQIWLFVLKGREPYPDTIAHAA